MNKLKNLKDKVLTKAMLAGATVSTLALSLFVAGVAKADTAADIASTTQTLGSTLQTNFVTVIEDLLPYVLGVVAIFVGIKIGLRWMKKSAR